MGILALALRLARFVVALVIVFGALKSVTLPDIEVLSAVLVELRSVSLGTFLDWIAANWQTFAIAYVFAFAGLNRRRFARIEESGDYSRILAGTLLSYLDVHTNVPSQRGEGAGAAELLIGYGILGVEPRDERLHSKPYRHGRQVTLRDDLALALQATDFSAIPAD